MTHDPLCPFFYDQTGRELVRQTGNPCTYCALIGRVREDERTHVKAKDSAYELFLTTLAEIGIEYKIAQHFVPAFGVKGFVSVNIFDEDGANWQCDFTEDGDFIGHEVSAV